MDESLLAGQRKPERRNGRCTTHPQGPRGCVAHSRRRVQIRQFCFKKHLGLLVAHLGQRLQRQYPFFHIAEHGHLAQPDPRSHGFAQLEQGHRRPHTQADCRVLQHGHEQCPQLFRVRGQRRQRIHGCGAHQRRGILQTVAHLHQDSGCRWARQPLQGGRAHLRNIILQQFYQRRAGGWQIHLPE